MRTADLVYHRPTGERWVVAAVDGDELSWCGWPEGRAKAADCELVKVATNTERLALLREMAAMPTQSDHRARYAKHVLAQESQP